MSSIDNYYNSFSKDKIINIHNGLDLRNNLNIYVE